MKAVQNLAVPPATTGPHFPSALRAGLLFGAGVVAVSLLSALLLPRSFPLAVIGDSLQVGLLAVAAVLAFMNFIRSHSHVRLFWFLIFLGMFMWFLSLVLWSFYELRYHQPAPDLPLGDILLFVKLVPFTAAIALEPQRLSDSRFRAFGLLDVAILMLYSLYVFAFFVYAFRLLPGATELYNFQFNVVDAIGNQIFTVGAAFALFRARGAWRGLYRIYFFAAALYCLSSDLSNVALDVNRYYTGSLYDVPFVTSMAAFVCFMLVGGSLSRDDSQFLTETGVSSEKIHVPTFAFSHLAMLVTLSTPVIGFWLLTSHTSPPALFGFRIVITLLTILLLTLLLSIKQDLLTNGLFGSLQRLSDNYASINRFKTHLLQTEKLTSLGELVAQVANQIKISMASIRESSSIMTSRPDSESRIQSMAGKIGQYAQRTDVLVENMLRFAQETPLQLVPLDLKPLLESALQLSGIAKHPELSVDIDQQGPCPPVRGDSSQLLHVFLQIISNAMDALHDASGGSLHISILPFGSQVSVQFADSGPGIREPEHVFEPFYTTKPVGQGTGLGLSTCYGIIQQHEGEIFCRNLAEGGALFAILLPIAGSQTVPASVSPSVAIEGAS